MIENPLAVFVIGLVVVVALLVWLRLPAFIGLVIAGLVVGAATVEVPFGEVPEEFAGALGDTFAGIGIPILMAAIIGKTMMESGAAERIVRWFQSRTGEERSYLALWGSSSALSIPVFFDNVFYLMAPLARSMRARTGRDYALFLTVVGAGAATTHVFVPPTPGPLAVALEIGVDLGIVMVIGLIVAIPTALVAGVLYGHWINRHLDDIPLRETMGSTAEELQEMADEPIEQLPGIFESTLPIIIAVVLVASNTTVDYLVDLGIVAEGSPLVPLTSFIGDANFALTAAALAAALTFLRMRALDRETWADELVEALRSGGHIAAITAAGGAFGAMLAAAGIGDYIAAILADVGIPLLVAGWVIAATIRIAQGSATVAMLTTAGIMAPLVGQLEVHPVYLALIIGAGGNICSWFNDSGFWIVKEIGGLTQLETLQIWTVLTTLISVTGFIIIMILSLIFPMV
ncbi:gluconate permease [Natronococcus pandeyae]|uniref:Gluconate permease n=1 Tax=Natronococcus pandeyae TaxID=2055836 RepID=A0A8J8Q7K3_9EURY|nr:SLC13 family permease [Natronococcus pandeyae]TYL40113.1 gluconate permease [Natronococcus pandeyae]